MNTRRPVLICHGRQGNLGDDFGPDDLAGWHNEVGVSAFIFSYPGYGKSGGVPSEAGCYAAAEAAYAWLTETQCVPPREVLLYGRSLGSAVAIDVASRHPHRALLLVTPFTSVPDVAEARYPFLPAQLADAQSLCEPRKIGRCTQPLLVLHGTDDRLIPFAMGKELFDTANAPKRFVAIAGASRELHHTGIFRDDSPFSGGGRTARPRLSLTAIVTYTPLVLLLNNSGLSGVGVPPSGGFRPKTA